VELQCRLTQGKSDTEYGKKLRMVLRFPFYYT